MTTRILNIVRKRWRELLCTAFLIAHLSLHVCPAAAQGLPIIRNYSAAEYNGHNRCWDIAVGDDGTVYVANFEGLLYYDRSRWRIIHTPDISRVTVVYRASDNTIWVGGYNFLARVRHRENGELYMQQVGGKKLIDGEVMEIFEDGGSLQFVASDNNLYEVKGGTGNLVPTVTLKKHTNTDFHIGIDSEVISVDRLKAGQSNVILKGIVQTEKLDGHLQVKVIKDEGLTIADDQSHDLYTITEQNGLCSNDVSYAVYDGHGLLWGATQHGIFSIELPSVYSYFTAKDGLAGEVNAITAFRGKMYVGTTNGLFVIDSYQCRRIPEISNICWTLCQKQDRLLAATSSGIYSIAPGGDVSRLTPYATTALSVVGDKVYAGEPDGVWLYLAGQRQQVCDLPLVTEIRQDANGMPWYQNVYGKTYGTAPIREKEPLEELPPQLLTPLSGIEVKAQYRDGDRIWIGGDEVVAIIDTGKKELTKLADSRRIRFCSIVTGSDSILWGGYGEMPKELRQLDSDKGHLHFYYALSHAPLSGKTLYRYKLGRNSIFGSDGQWSGWTERQDIEFLNLPSGSYTLSVEAQLANGELSDVAAVDFSIAYPLAMRWYMVVLYFLLAGWLVYLLFRYRLKRLQRDKMKLEHIVEERTSEVVKQKDEIVRQKDEIEEKSKNLEKALDDLNSAQNELIRQEKMATVGKLTEGLIDRILNPMNYIINFSKMSNDLLKDLKENIDHNKDRIDEADYEDTLDVLDMLTENLQSVDQYGQNTTRTLKAMEEMLKDRSGGYTHMDLLPVLQQNEQMLNNYFSKEKEQYHIGMTFTLPTEAMPLWGNPEMLSKTIMSLLGNAVYAVVKKRQRKAYEPEVSLTVATIAKHYILKIHDNGIGIEETILDKIFDPFFTTKTTSEAAGVGLYLSREIIQNHGGDISVESVKDQFTEFTITLPIEELKN